MIKEATKVLNTSKKYLSKIKKDPKTSPKQKKAKSVGNHRSVQPIVKEKTPEDLCRDLLKQYGLLKKYGHVKMNKETEQRILQAKQLSIEKSQSNTDEITVRNIDQDLAIVD